MKVFHIAIVLALCCGAGMESSLQAQTPMESATAKAASSIPKPEGEKQADAGTAMPAQPNEAILGDPATRLQYLTAMQRYYEYRADGYAYRSRVFEWQLLSSRMIFLVVILLVTAGIYFAAAQFKVAMIMAKRNIDTPAPKDAPNMMSTQFEVSAKGVVVNSSVLGVIILTLSLAFLYLYLVHVYPIQNVL